MGDKSMNIEDRKDCPYRTDMGNCLPHGGFCPSVGDDRCKKHIQNALDFLSRMWYHNTVCKIPDFQIKETYHERMSIRINARSPEYGLRRKGTEARSRSNSGRRKLGQSL